MVQVLKNEMMIIPVGPRIEHSLSVLLIYIISASMLYEYRVSMIGNRCPGPIKTRGDNTCDDMNHDHKAVVRLTRTKDVEARPDSETRSSIIVFDLTLISKL